MSATAPLYRKIPGGGLTWKGNGGLWLAEDHLLEVSSIVILEHYRRFFFHDVRAFVIQRTNGRSLWAWLLGGVSALCALVGGAAWWFGRLNASEDWHIVLYFPAGLFGLAALILLILLMVNLALGPACRCHLLTSTGWHALSAPRRLGRALAAQTQLISIIQAAQSHAPAPEAVPS